MTQYAMVVKVWINMKSYHDFVFQYCVFFIQSILSVWYKSWETQKISWKFVRPQKIAEILRNPEK